MKTGGKGLTFVSFKDKANAQKVIDKVHGRGYHNLIINVQWSHESIIISPLNPEVLTDPLLEPRLDDR